MWYLVGLPSYKNLTEATQLLLARCQAEIVAASKMEEPAQNESGQPIISIEEWRPKEPAHVEKMRLTRRAGRKTRYEQVVQRRSQGLTAKEIARQLDMSERTVQKWLAAGTFPEAKKRRKKPSSFDTFAPYVLKRWQEGERNGLTLWREIQKKATRDQSVPSIAMLKRSSRRTFRLLSIPIASTRLQPAPPSGCLSVTPRAWMRSNKRIWRYSAKPTSPSNGHMISFRMRMQMVRKREGHRLDAWLERIATSDLAELQPFAAGVEKDKAAVKAGLTWSINNAQVEGHVTKLKLIKRTMYGKAGFPLLRQRVLHAV